MIRVRLLVMRAGIATYLVLWALATPVFAQGVVGAPGGGALPSTPGGFNAPGASRKSGDAILRPPSNPGLAEPLDIRIQGEGLSLPPGVSEDEPVRKPADDRASQGSAPPENPAQPDPKRP